VVATILAGVDLGGTKIQTVVMAGSQVVGSARELTPQTGSDDVVATIASTLRTALSEAGIAVTGIGGIGIGAPGGIDAAAGIVTRCPNLAGFEEPVELGSLVSRSFGGVPVHLDNDVRVAMLGEHRRGAARPFKDVLGVFVGTGVGGGIVLGNKVREGAGAAGEIGHTIVKDGGRPCSCGRPGHLESYAGRGRIEWAARKMVKKGEQTVLFDLKKKKQRTQLSSGVIEEALEKKDPLTLKLIDEAIWALGIAIASAQNLLEVEAIIIGGGLGDRLGEPFVERIAAEVAPRLFTPERAPAIIGTELGDLSGAVGAAVLAAG
jgi:glucokinase